MLFSGIKRFTESQTRWKVSNSYLNYKYKAARDLNAQSQLIKSFMEFLVINWAIQIFKYPIINPLNALFTLIFLSMPTIQQPVTDFFPLRIPENILLWPSVRYGCHRNKSLRKQLINIRPLWPQKDFKTFPTKKVSKVPVTNWLGKVHILLPWSGNERQHNTILQ